MADVNNINNKTLFAKNASVVESTPVRSEVIDTGTDVVVIATTVGPNTVPYFNEDAEYIAKSLNEFGDVLVQTEAVKETITEAAEQAAVQAAAQSTQESKEAAEAAKGYALSASEFGINKVSFIKTQNDPTGTIAGIAATTSGQYFQVYDGVDSNSASTIYLNDSGTAVAVSKRPGIAAIIGVTKEYPDSALAQIDILAGNIKNNALLYITEYNDIVIAKEYVNKNGVITSTGRSKASSYRVELLEALVDSNSRTLDQLISMALIKSNKITTSGEYTNNTNGIAELESCYLPAGLSAPKRVLIQNAGVLLDKILLPNESISKGTLTSEYKKVGLDDLNVNAVIIETGTVRVALAPNVLNGVVRTNEYTAFDLQQDFISIKASEGSTTSLRSVCLHSSGSYIQLVIPKSELAEGNYTQDVTGVQKYLKDKWAGKVLYYRSTIVTTSKVPYLFPVSTSTISVLIEASINIILNVFNAYNNTAVDSIYLNSLNSYIANYLKEEGKYTRLLFKGSPNNIPSYSNKNRMLILNNIRMQGATDAEYQNRILDLNIKVDGVSIARRVVPPNKTEFKDGKLYSYTDIKRMSELKIAEIRYSDGVNTSTDYSSAAVMLIVKLIKKDGTSWPLTDTRISGALDLNGKFNYIAGNDAPQLRTDIASSLGGYNGNGCIQFSVPVTELVSNSVSLVDYNAIYSYLKSKSIESVFSYRNNIWNTVNKLDDVGVIFVPPGKLTIEGVSDRAGIITSIYEEKPVSNIEVGKYIRLTCDVKNSTSLAYNNYPIELKVEFPEGAVPNQHCIIVQDEAGVIYPCQFAAAEHPNQRSKSNIGYHPDGSLSYGSLFILATIAAGDTKFFEIKAYSTAQNTDYEINSLNIVDPSTRSITVDGYTLSFTDSGVVAAGAWALNTIMDKLNTIHNITLNMYFSGSTWNQGAYQEAGFQSSSTIQLINSGPIYSEVEVVSYNLPMDNVPSHALKTTIRYRLFKNGKLQIKIITATQIELPVGVLSGVIARTTFSDGNYPYTSAAASINFTDTISAKNWAVNVIRANGDVHRDGTTYGPTRPIMLEVRNPSSSSVRLYSGWKMLQQDTYSFLNWPIKKGWTWTIEMWFDMESDYTSAQTSLSKVLNRPIGFLGKSSYPTTIARKVLSLIETHMDGSMDWWYSGDALKWEGGPGNTRIFKYASVNYDIVRYLKDGIGTLDSIYNQLEDVVKYTGVPNLSTIGTYYLSGNNLLQFASRISVPPLHWLYKVAEKEGNTVVLNKVKIAIKSFADAIVTYFTANGGVSLNGSTVGKGNSNSNATGLRIIALGIMSGQDTNGSYLSTYNGIQALLMQESSFMYTQNILKEGPSDVLPAAWWVHYQIFAYNNYLLGARAAGISRAFDMDNFILSAASPLGGFNELDYCISESRRGSFNTISFAAYPMILSKRASLLNALDSAMDLFYSEYGPQPGLPKRYFGFDGYQAGSNTATNDVAFCATTFADVWLDQYFEHRSIS